VIDPGRQVLTRINTFARGNTGATANGKFRAGAQFRSAISLVFFVVCLLVILGFPRNPQP
jgi:hypothetical protein